MVESGRKKGGGAWQSQEARQPREASALSLLRQEYGLGLLTHGLESLRTGVLSGGRCVAMVPSCAGKCWEVVS